MRRWIFVALALALAVPVVGEAGRGRLGQGAQGNLGVTISNPITPPTSFSEILTVQTLATDGHCNQSIQGNTNAIATGNHRIFLAYMKQTPGECNSGAHDFVVKMYDYATGSWTTSATLDSINPGCCDVHEAPNVFLNPADGKLRVLYAPMTSGEGGNPGPYVLKGTNAHSISAFDARTTVTAMLGGLSEPSGGYDGSNVLHFVGQHQRTPATGFLAWSTNYARQLANGIWEAVPLLRNPNQTYTPNGSPSVGLLFVQASRFHLTWTLGLDGGASEDRRDIYYATSTDGGDTWRNAATTASFTRTAGLSPTLNATTSRYEWPSYRVYESSASNGAVADVRALPAVAALSDGTPVIVAAIRSGTSALKIFKWNGSSWDTIVVDTAASGDSGSQGIVVNGADRVLVYGSISYVNMWQWHADSPHTSWIKTQLWNSAGVVARYPNPMYVPSIGGKSRVFVPWSSGSGTTATQVRFLDIPQ